MKPIAEIIKKSNNLRGLNMSIDEVVVHLYKDGYTITDSIIAVELILKTNMTVAKEIVSSNSVWASVVKVSKPLVDELIEIIKEEGNLIELPNGTIKYHEKLN